MLLLQFAPNKGIHELIKKVDVSGPLAFEDEPGTWFYTNSENGACLVPHSLSRPDSMGWLYLSCLQGASNP